MNHYCTYFDQGFLIQGLALWLSLKEHDPEAVLWVLALDDETQQALLSFGDARLRTVALSELEKADGELCAARGNRTKIEYYFTLSPCWPLYVLRWIPEIAEVVYLDADMMVTGSLSLLREARERHVASVLITQHRFPLQLREHYERHGIFNVGILLFRNDSLGLAVLEDWRRRCLEWCKDVVEPARYADQKYLDAWPEHFGSAVHVLSHPGVNFAPWNWRNHDVRVDNAGCVLVDQLPLLIYHFARFRPFAGTCLWQSGQLDYGVMPFSLRNAIYGPYWRMLVLARTALRAKGLPARFARRALRLNRSWFRLLFLRILFGTDWLRLGDRFYSAGFGLGRSSGLFLARLRKYRLRK